jgi:hypothetical protein
MGASGGNRTGAPKKHWGERGKPQRENEPLRAVREEGVRLERPMAPKASGQKDDGIPFKPEGAVLEVEYS